MGRTKGSSEETREKDRRPACVRHGVEGGFEEGMGERIDRKSGRETRGAKVESQMPVGTRKRYHEKT